MLKRYIAVTQLRICVGCRSFAFENFVNGQSYYETSDPNEQQMIESHKEFRLTFDLDQTLLERQRLIEEEAERKRVELEEKRKRLEDEKIKAQQEYFESMNHQSTGMEEKPVENQPTVELEITDDGFTIVEAQSINDAKEYIKSHFGIAKSRMMRHNDLLDRAQECKIKFVGKDFK